ncbi:MAG: single-stranded-DNA-specific exonuclease RecJ [Candidatus Delongbacteria bacterium]|nr:single-stranded-DNA-specific exonuclease RecJ [Candidatus Delongbacteria bacterium]
MEKRWEFKNDPEPYIIDDLASQTGLPSAILKLLVSRGYKTREDIETFLHPENVEYHDPFLMKDMDKAVERVIEALVNRENILIWGDYDVDGITSTSILYLFFLRRLGLKVDYAIPNRESEGYGLSNNGILQASKNGVDLIITVDCGITSVQEVEYAKSLGIDIIITDHHEPDNELPKAYAIIDPKRNDCDYPYKHLAGVGVAFKLIQGILANNDMPLKISEKFINITAIGTAADIVPMTGENRKIVYEGLRTLGNCPNIGLSTLLKKLNFYGNDVKVNHILFGLAPRINAVGRMGDAERAVNLLITNDIQEATEIVADLELENKRRREFDAETLSEAINILEEVDHFDPKADKAIVVANENWHVGVIGIVASRLVEKYYRPSVVISINDGIGKGSCRSISGINIYEVLTECYELNLLEQENFGGHNYAAGFEIDSKNIPEFKKKFNEIISRTTPDKDFKPFLKIDLKIDFNDIDQDMMDNLYLFEPFGPYNEQPVFATENVDIVGEVRIVGSKLDSNNRKMKSKGNHLRMKLRQNGIVFDAIGFNLADKFDLVNDLRSNLKFAYLIEENNWNGSSYIQLKIKDILA